MAPALLFALLALAADQAGAGSAASQGGPPPPPSDDYGYVAWCLGAQTRFDELYDTAMPEVIRIERAFPTPSTEDNIANVYPAQREAARRNIVLFKQAMEAAEKASARPLQAHGVAAITQGRNIWTPATLGAKATLAQFFMSWAPPARCEDTAKTLLERSQLFGQALQANAKAETPADEAPAPEETPEVTAEPPEETPAT